MLKPLWWKSWRGRSTYITWADSRQCVPCKAPSSKALRHSQSRRTPRQQSLRLESLSPRLLAQQLLRLLALDGRLANRRLLSRVALRSAPPRSPKAVSQRAGDQTVGRQSAATLGTLAETLGTQISWRLSCDSSGSHSLWFDTFMNLTFNVYGIPAEGHQMVGIKKVTRGLNAYIYIRTISSTCIHVWDCV